MKYEFDYDRETLIECLTEENKEILKKHWDEIGYGPYKIPFDPDYALYFQLEAADQLMVIVARERESREVAGYVVFIAPPATHHKDIKMAVVDITYVKPKYRRMKVFSNMLKFSEITLTQLGFDFINIGANVNYKRAGKIFKRKGYHEIETYYSKKLGSTK